MSDRTWTVVETVGQEYFYHVKASSKQEAIEKVKQGKSRMAKSTKEMKPTYNAH